MLEPTISLGNLITISVIIVSATGFILAIKLHTQLLEMRMEQQEKLLFSITSEMSKIEQILISLAQAAGRMDRIEDHLRVSDGRVEELRTRCILLTTIPAPHLQRTEKDSI
jgi:hypothetical protein